MPPRPLLQLPARRASARRAGVLRLRAAARHSPRPVDDRRRARERPSMPCGSSRGREIVASPPALVSCRCLPLVPRGRLPVSASMHAPNRRASPREPGCERLLGAPVEIVEQHLERDDRLYRLASPRQGSERGERGCDLGVEALVGELRDRELAAAPGRGISRAGRPSARARCTTGATVGQNRTFATASAPAPGCARSPSLRRSRCHELTPRCERDARGRRVEASHAGTATARAPRRARPRRSRSAARCAGSRGDGEPGHVPR